MGRIAAGMDFGREVVQHSRAPAVDTSQGVAAVAGALDRVAGQQVADGQQLQREQDAEAKRAAREAQVIRERADAATAQARAVAMRDGLADELDRIGQEVQEGRLPKTEAAKAWQERTAKILADGIEAVPEVHRGTVTADIQAQAGRLTSKVGDIVRRRDQHDTLSAINQVQEYTQRLAITEPDKARQILADTLDQLGPFAGLQPDQITKAKQGWSEGVAYTRAFTAVNAAKSDNKALAVVEKGINENADLDPQRKATLLAQIDGFRSSNEARALRQAQHAEIVAARVQRQSDEAFNVLSGWALQGKAADPSASAALISKLTPTAAAAYRAMAAEIPARTAVAMLPLDTQAQQLDQLKARAVAGTSVELEREIKRREEVLTQARKDYADDPLRAANERGVITSPLRPLNTSSMDAIAAGLAERAAQAQEVATVTRRPVSPLLSEEAQRVGDILNALPVAERGRRIAQMADLLPGGMLLALAHQIGGEDNGARRALALEMQFGADKTVSGRFRSELVARGAQAIKDKGVKEDTSAEFGLRAQIVKEIGDSLPARWREDAIDAARLMYLGQKAEGGSPSVRGVVRLAAGGDIVEHNGRRIPIPAGMDEGQFKAKLKAYPADELAKQLRGAPPSRPASMVEPGNIDFNKRPVVRNTDGSFSTIESMSANFGGVEVLLPTITPDGKRMSEDAAVAHYQRTGQHLGKFSDAKAADAYAKALSQSQGDAYTVVLPGGRRITVDQFLAALPDAQLEPVAPGRFGVRAGGGIVMGATGRPIIIEVR